MKQISHTINRDGKVVKANGFKQPTPTVAMQKPNLWMHSIERNDAANPVHGFFMLIGLGIAVILLFTLFGAILK